MAALVLMALLFTGLVPLLQPVQATTLSSIFPTSGTVGTSVNVQGTIDVLGGLFHLTFDGMPVAFGQAALGSDVVNINFIVPFANGSDVGAPHTVALVDNGTSSIDFAAFFVITARTVFGDPARIQEGDFTGVTVNVTGGISAPTTYDFDLNLTDPEGGFHLASLSVSTDALGSGENSTDFPANFTLMPNTNFVGAYSIVVDETAPGSIADAANGSFEVGLTDLASYERLTPVSISSTGWGPVENVTLDIRRAGASVVIGTITYPITLAANGDGNVSHLTDLLPKGIATGTYTVTVVNNTGAGTVKVPADVQDFEVTVSTGIVVSVITSPTGTFMRTTTATAVLAISYPGTLEKFNASRFASITVGVINATGVKVADVSLAVTDFDASAPTDDRWNASWKIPKDAGAPLAHNLTVQVGQVVDVDGNNGPDPEEATTPFTVIVAVLGVVISDGPAVVAEEFNRTSTVTLELRASYPDASVFAPADLGSFAVNVTFDDPAVPFDVANLTLSASDFNAVTGNWTAQWVIPFNAALTITPTFFQYNFTVRPGEITDPFGNDNTAFTFSNDFNVTAVTLIVPLIGTDRGSYEREEQVFIFFQAFYLDGSSVTTGNTGTMTPGLEVERPDGITFFLNATFQPARNRFEVIHFLTPLDPTGTWTVRLELGGLVDSAGNAGANVTRNVTFEVVRAVEVIQVEADAGSLHFRGEIAQFYVISANRGSLLDVTYDAVDVYTPDGLVVSLLATRTAVGIGISRFDYPIPTNAVVGTYSLVVSVSVIFPQTEGRGVTLTSFRISAEMSGFIVNVTGDIATIQTDVGLIQADLAAINPVIISISNGVATILTDVGVIRADVSAINAVVTDIQGDMATVVTDVGILRGQITGIEGGIARIETNVGDIRADISGVADLSPAVGTILTILYIATALALIAAIAAIAAVWIIMRRLAV